MTLVVAITAVAWHIGDQGQSVRSVSPVRDKKGKEIEFETTIEAGSWPTKEEFGLVTFELYKRLQEAGFWKRDDFASFNNIQMRVTVCIRDNNPKPTGKVY